MTRKTKLVAAAGAAAVLAAAAVTAVLLVRRAKEGPAADPRQASAQKQVLVVGTVAAAPALWVDVHAPATAWKAARENPWVKKALAEPLGQGMGAGLAAFLGTRGTDLANAFEGTVLDLVMAKLLADPFRVVILGGAEATGAPVIVVPEPSSPAEAAFEILETAAANGTYEAQRCPGADAPLAETLFVSRWLVADHAVFAARMDGRMALARNPVAVVQALCAKLPALAPQAGVDLAVTFARAGLGREPLLGATLLGLGETTTLQFGLEKGTLVPRGIAGALAAGERLGAAPPRDELLKVLPGDAGVVLLTTLDLPEALDRTSLSAHLRGAYQGKRLARTVAVLWNPGPGTTEVAVAWPERDAAFLREAFTGPNELLRVQACGHVVLASTASLASAAQRSCAGKAPSLLNAAPAVVAGLRQPASLLVNVNAGLVLSRALAEAWTAEKGKSAASPEIESARRLLEELPSMGLRGVAKGGALQPGGYKS
jgi:hypothetical protein